MSLKQDIVIKIKYTLKNPVTGKGSMGSTPGQYVRGYMARKNAIDPITPMVRDPYGADDDRLSYRYKRRKEYEEADYMSSYDDPHSDELTSVDPDNPFSSNYLLDENTDDDSYGMPLEAKNIIKDYTKNVGFGGAGFGYGKVSLTHDELVNASKDMQNLFDHGHTVQLVVLSFTLDYMKKNGIVDPDFVFRTEGDFSGNIDQYRLRRAIMHGMDRSLDRLFDDPRYLGVIQVDTGNIHCHLAVVDAGPGRRAADGTQKGKLPKTWMRDIRRGIDADLDKNKELGRLVSLVSADKTNIRAHMAAWAENHVSDSYELQKIYSLLPEDKSLWRAGSHAASMTKANDAARAYVVRHMQAESGVYADAYNHVVAYADKRKEKEGLSDEEYSRLVDNGMERIISGGINGIYGVMKQYSTDDEYEASPSLKVASMSDDECETYDEGAEYDAAMSSVVGQSPEMIARRHAQMATMAMLVRERKAEHYLTRHVALRNMWQDRVEEFVRADNNGMVTDDARCLYDFYKTEYTYHHYCVSRYERLVSHADMYEENKAWSDFAHTHEQAFLLRSLIDDETVRTLDPTDAEAYGSRVYEQDGGHYLSDSYSKPKYGRRVMESRWEKLRSTCKKLYNTCVSFVKKRAGRLVDKTDVYDVSSHSSAGFVDDVTTSDYGVAKCDVDVRDYVGGARSTLSFTATAPLLFPYGEATCAGAHNEMVHTSMRGRSTFVDMATRRRRVCDAAYDYLIRSGQESMAHALTDDVYADVDQMDDFIVSGRIDMPYIPPAYDTIGPLSQQSEMVKSDTSGVDLGDTLSIDTDDFLASMYGSVDTDGASHGAAHDVSLRGEQSVHNDDYVPFVDRSVKTVSLSGMSRLAMADGVSWNSMRDDEWTRIGS